MKIQSNFNLNKSNFKQEKAGTLKEMFLSYGAEYNSQDNSLILKYANGAMHDSRQTIYINKDGSGRLLADRGTKTYKKGTFENTIKLAKEIANKKGARYSNEDSQTIYKQARIDMNIK